jgi:hypothetical protein
MGIDTHPDVHAHAIDHTYRISTCNPIPSGRHPQVFPHTHSHVDACLICTHFSTCARGYFHAHTHTFRFLPMGIRSPSPDTIAWMSMDLGSSPKSKLHKKQAGFTLVNEPPKASLSRSVNQSNIIQESRPKQNDLGQSTTAPLSKSANRCNVV